MDGIHDLGGKAGFGSIDVERDEPVFHEPWESLAFRLNLACVGVLRHYNVDEYRHAIERMAPAHYLAASYYDRVLTAVASLLIERGVVSQAELEAKSGGGFRLAQPVRPNVEDGLVARSAPTFGVGDRVRVRKLDRPGHTRAPGYVRGHSGTVIHVAPDFNYPDAAAHGLRRRKEPTYHVDFAAAELWPDAEATADSVVVDLWESYLEAAE